MNIDEDAASDFNQYALPSAVEPVPGRCGCVYALTSEVASSNRGTSLRIASLVSHRYWLDALSIEFEFEFGEGGDGNRTTTATSWFAGVRQR